MAISYEHAGNYKTAVDMYDLYLCHAPDDENAWYNRAIVLEKLNDVEKAIDSYKMAISLDETFEDALYNLGHLTATLQRFEESITYFKKALEIDKHDDTTLYMLGSNYLELGDIKTALKYLNRAVAENPDSEDPYLDRGYCFYAMGLVNRSLEDLRMAILKNSYRDELWIADRGGIPDEKDIVFIGKHSNSNPWELEKEDAIRVGECYMRTSQYKKALLLFRDLYMKYGPDAVLTQNIAKTYFLDGKPKSGFYFLLKTLKLDQALGKKFEYLLPTVAASDLYMNLRADRTLFKRKKKRDNNG